MLVRFIALLLLLGIASCAKNSAFPVDLPDPFSGSVRKIFGNYFSPYPVSLDNRPPLSDYYARNYLNASGEGGKHLVYGGLLRDRPLPVQPNPNNTIYRLKNLELEVQQAIDSGLEGFVVDLLVLHNNTDNPIGPVPALLMQAAQNVDPRFKIIMQPDMTTIFERITNEEMAVEIDFLAKFPSAYRIDGKVVVCPFLTENRPVYWWSQTFDILRQKYNTEVAFFPLFLNAGNYTAWANISIGMANWGNRSPKTNPTTNYDIIKNVQKLGKLWMHPVSVQDTRPRSSIWDESQNFDNLMATWNVTVNGGADWAHLITWNDYSEGTQFNPSVRHGWVNLDIGAYWIAKMRSGVEPPIVRDAVYLSHRTQFVNATPLFVSTSPMTLRAGSSPARDTIQVLSFLKSAGYIEVMAGDTVYNCTVGAGISTCTFPLQLGNISAQLYRDGKLISSVATQFEVVATPYNQNYDYTVASSRRDANNVPIDDPDDSRTSTVPNPASSASRGEILIFFTTLVALFLL